MSFEQQRAVAMKFVDRTLREWDCGDGTIIVQVTEGRPVALEVEGVVKERIGNVVTTVRTKTVEQLM